MSHSPRRREWRVEATVLVEAETSEEAGAVVGLAIARELDVLEAKVMKVTEV